MAFCFLFCFCFVLILFCNLKETGNQTTTKKKFLLVPFLSYSAKQGTNAGIGKATFSLSYRHVITGCEHWSPGKCKVHLTKYLDTFCAYFKGNAGSLFSVLVLFYKPYIFK